MLLGLGQASMGTKRPKRLPVMFEGISVCAWLELAAVVAATVPAEALLRWGTAKWVPRVLVSETTKSLTASHHFAVA